MKPSRVAGVAATLVAIAGTSQAQNRAVSDLPPYEWQSTWTGLYVGAAIGGMAAIQHNNSTVNGVTFSNQGVGGQGVLASIYGGYDLQVLPKALVGVLAEGTWASPQTS